MHSTADPPGLPRRLCGTATRSGIVLGPDLHHIREARRWAVRATRARANVSEAVGLAVSELVTNALTHTASGLPGGQVLVELHRAARLELRVTDDGPRPGLPPTLPAVPEANPLRPGGLGLRLLEGVCAYWDWTRAADRRVTVRAVFRR
ncbi:ATP-binding protein [Nocardiopsis sp. LOL_012]|uniref:ATP-binding protein n=1 Tax=Nocardiopsis sp. LOL_012 TaxID=3345409 RepID=UPI003A849A24